MNNELKTAGDFLKGGIVIFPTDTAFGIGCRIDNEESVERLFKIRKGPMIWQFLFWSIALKWRKVILRMLTKRY